MAEPSASIKIVPTLLVVAAGFALAVGSVLTKRYGPFEPLKLMAWMSLLTVPQVMATSLVIEHGQLTSLHTVSPAAWWAFAYTVLFGAVAGWGLWFWLIARCSITRVAPFALTAQVIGIAIHELATNAGKYGALANDKGRIALHWQVEPGKDSGETFVMTWREQDGPSVKTPSRAGFGSTVLSWVVRESFDAEVSLDYEPSGLVWRL